MRARPPPDRALLRCPACRPALAKGFMQLFSFEQQKSQPLEAHAAAFSIVKVGAAAPSARSRGAAAVALPTLPTEQAGARQEQALADSWGGGGPGAPGAELELVHGRAEGGAPPAACHRAREVAHVGCWRPLLAPH
jgi:hypothetical protein